ncbi:polymorphic toxin-type HINT domain-containing protein [Chitinimonas sp.]|uniref:polymorphic toxin-type HINT domain-containing protein n=1 Tax=Chitinimonas sp. TaxID=1934313 RepID=UPI0035AF2A70
MQEIANCFGVHYAIHQRVREEGLSGDAAKQREIEIAAHQNEIRITEIRQEINTEEGGAAKVSEDGVLEANPHSVCFEEDTLVHTDFGLCEIKCITPGVKVLSRCEKIGAMEYKEVLRVFMHEDREVYSILIALVDPETGQEYYLRIIATGDHPFYVPNVGWVALKDLQCGQLLICMDGRSSVVLEVKLKSFTADVYNLEVADFHTYFVGNDGIWVHNDCHPDWSVLPEQANASKELLGDISVEIGNPARDAISMKEKAISEIMISRDVEVVMSSNGNKSPLSRSGGASPDCLLNGRTADCYALESTSTNLVKMRNKLIPKTENQSSDIVLGLAGNEVIAKNGY